MIVLAIITLTVAFVIGGIVWVFDDSRGDSGGNIFPS